MSRICSCHNTNAEERCFFSLFISSSLKSLAIYNIHTIFGSRCFNLFCCVYFYLPGSWQSLWHSIVHFGELQNLHSFPEANSLEECCSSTRCNNRKFCFKLTELRVIAEHQMQYFLWLLADTILVEEYTTLKATFVKGGDKNTWEFWE